MIYSSKYIDPTIMYIIIANKKSPKKNTKKKRRRRRETGVLESGGDGSLLAKPVDGAHRGNVSPTSTAILNTTRQTSKPTG
jgi:hypothetical protein